MSKDGLCVIVTGSASGLGAATAAILAKGDARIVVNYSSSQKESEQTFPSTRVGSDVLFPAGEEEDETRMRQRHAVCGEVDEREREQRRDERRYQRDDQPAVLSRPP